jgi:organic radical activating enzyme
MFGKNPIEKKDQGDGMTLHLVKGSPFRTIQGEGPYAGRPAIFVRLHGCNLACTFCDTQFSHPNDPTVPLPNLIRQIVSAFGAESKKLVVVTGGEPLRQNILPLCKELSFYGSVCQIETAGTLWLDYIESFTEIVASPKTPSIHPKVFAHAKAFKYIIDVEQKFDGFIPITATQEGARPAPLAAPRPGAPVYLSPMDTYDEDRNKANCKLVGQLALKYGCHAGLQVHKYLDLE